jgi:hypothetical protein
MGAWRAGGAVLLAAVCAGGWVTVAQTERRWVAFDGREWTQFAPGEKRAYVAGFLAGAALADGERTALRDTTLLRRAVDSLYRVGGLRYPFGQMVYATQLDEFYWWDNHVPTPLYLALRDINVRLKGQDE